MVRNPLNDPGPEDEDTDFREDVEVDGPEDEAPPEQEYIEEPRRPETDIERQARQMGWHPKEEFLGPPHRWKSAEEFMRQGNDVLPILRDNNKRLLERADRQDRELQTLRQSMAEQTQALQELREMARTARQSGYDRAVSDLRVKQREAAASGDIEVYDQVSEQIEETVKARAEAVKPPPPPQPPQQQVPQEVVNWVNRNPLYNTDQVLNFAMRAEHQRLVEDEPELSLTENLEKAWDTVKRRYPKKFGLQPNGNGQVPPRRAPVQQPTGGHRPPRQSRQAGIDQIEDAAEKAEARAAYNRLRNQIPGYTEDEYMQVYNNPKADIIEVRRNIREAVRK